MYKVFDGVLNKTLKIEKDEFENEKEFFEYTESQKRIYKGFYRNKYVCEEADAIIQDLVYAKAYLYLIRSEQESGEELPYDEDSIIKGVTNGDINSKGDGNRFIDYFRQDNDDGTSDFYHDYRENSIEDAVEAFDDEDYKLSEKERRDLAIKLKAFFDDCVPTQYHYNELLDIVTIEDPDVKLPEEEEEEEDEEVEEEEEEQKKKKKPKKEKREITLPEKFVQLIISLVLIVLSLVAGLAVLPNVIPDVGWAIGAGVIAVGLALGSIVLKPTPAVRFFKLCLLGFKVFHSLDLWQRENMQHTGVAVLIVFPLFFIFAILAFAVTLVIGLVIGILMPILVAIVFLIPYQIKGWTNTL